MEYVKLVFPNSASMADFIMEYKVGNVITYTVDCSVTGLLSQENITLAIELYGAAIIPNSVDYQIW